ncbi:His Kinase A (phospho-acceptor) domain-containing protein [Butyrivibrio fibrisolvens]|uniref:histidine kinase n=1 Tax=Butyrivibrio fibrisolvens TaxID=831 RepID=A0A1H9WMW2_BUTFI|nr:HAMP domain-containing sensor histidine kinase [Butyrivibrio fibrisolvens]SES35262.1 His Kinase A (phospho-acceptor) domain-containing protein [Butyrivibrio fibrisolvens]
MKEHSKKRYDEPSLGVEDLSQGLYKSNLKLGSINQKQSEYFSNISHDLRSPIAAIRSAIEYLEETPGISTDDRKNLYRLIDKKAASLEYMIDEIFLLSKLSSNSTIVRPVPLPCGNYLEDFFFTNEADSKFKDVDLVLDVPMSFEYTIEIDPNYFDRVLNNLFDNALRYLGEDGSITLSASTDESKTHVIISVSDNGSGISPDNIDKIFERSFTGDISRTPSGKSGAGLGLSICKKIVEIHSGTITCRSKTGSDHGTTFAITLPILKD